jgi:hypothetical protein
VVEDLNATTETIMTKLNGMGLTVALATVQTVRSDAKIMLRILLAKGCLNEPMASRVRAL